MGQSSAFCFSCGSLPVVDRTLVNTVCTPGCLAKNAVYGPGHIDSLKPKLELYLQSITTYIAS